MRAYKLLSFTLLLSCLLSFSLLQGAFSSKSFPVLSNEESSLVELADITYRYYSSLSEGDFSVIVPILHNEFVVDNVISFYDRNKAVSFLESMYKNRFSSLELSSIVILSYADYLKASLDKDDRYSVLRGHFSSGEYVTFVPDMRVGDAIVFSGVYLVFLREGSNWYIRGMYHY